MDSIYHLPILAFLLFLLVFNNVVDGQGMCAEKVIPLGYDCTEHTVTTKDGYILALQNILPRESPKFWRGLMDEKGFAPSSSHSFLRGIFLENQALEPPQFSYLTQFSTPSQATFPPKSSIFQLPSQSPSPLASPSLQPSLSPSPSQSPAPSPSPSSRKLGIVILLHPPLVAGDFWIYEAGNSKRDNLCLPFLLTQSGFDVWIGNLRATRWSHANTNFTSKERAFWNWSWDELARYDFPSLLNYIIGRTGASTNSVHVIGYSINNAVALASVITSTLSTYIGSLTMISPAIYLGNTNSTALEIWAWLTGPLIDTFMVETGISNGAFNASLQTTQALISTDTDYGRALLGNIFGNALAYAFDGSPCCFPEENFANFSFDNNGWDGTTAYKNLQHIQQMIRRNAFAKYQEYSGDAEEFYDPSTLPDGIRVLLVHGGKDNIATPKNIEELVSRFGSVSVSKLFLPEYAHLDLAFSTTVSIDVFHPIMRFLMEAK